MNAKISNLARVVFGILLVIAGGYISGQLTIWAVRTVRRHEYASGYVAQAVQSRERGDLLQSYNAYEAASYFEPENGEIISQEVGVALEAGATRDAVSVMERKYGQLPPEQYAQLATSVADALLDVGDYQQAGRFYEKAMDADDTVENKLKLLNFYLLSGNIDAYQEAMSADGDLIRPDMNIYRINDILNKDEYTDPAELLNDVRSVFADGYILLAGYILNDNEANFPELRKRWDYWFYKAWVAYYEDDPDKASEYLKSAEYYGGSGSGIVLLHDSLET